MFTGKNKFGTVARELTVNCVECCRSIRSSRWIAGIDVVGDSAGQCLDCQGINLSVTTAWTLTTRMVGSNKIKYISYFFSSKRKRFMIDVIHRSDCVTHCEHSIQYS